MIKVLIVDDEMLVRVGIKSLIDWSEHGFEIVGMALDGEEALEMIEKNMPNIILTDIVMPKMDGIELIRRVKSQYPFISILVLSCYNDFSYVREAMKLGADDYLLKISIKPDELITLLKETVAKNIEKQNGWNNLAVNGSENIHENQKEKAVLLLIEGHENGKALVEKYKAIDFDMEINECVILVIRMHKKRQVDDSIKIVDEAVKNLAYNVISEVMKTSIVKRSDVELVAVAAISRDGKKVSNENIIELCGDLVNKISDVLNLGINIGISNTFRGLANARQAYRNARQALSLSFFKGPGSVFPYCPGYNYEKRTKRFRELENIFCMRIKIMDCKVMRQLFEEMFTLMYRFKPPIDYCKQIIMNIVRTMLDVLESKQLDLSDMPVRKDSLYTTVADLEFLEDAKAWMESIMDSFSKKVQKSGVKYRPEITRLLSYIHEHYNENITLSWAADFVNLSENHLSSLFKKETNKTFIKYLEEYRIEKAAELLRETKLPSYEIALRVGYDNTNYFGRVFKKVTGYGPRKYRNYFARMDGEPAMDD